MIINNTFKTMCEAWCGNWINPASYFCEDCGVWLCANCSSTWCDFVHPEARLAKPE